ncbi:type II toxin-antitoxin system VapC family toxin [Microbacterium foliorum]|uniref:Ribonuclease VapC n=1 Tax=Microbacterium foliorum TaxID=104336 RepID=A0A4Y5YLY6_9MICO|nr:type II toxin-antitoxin system VapC family toxin [Microbacterium foliorum]QDE33493.1 type II toxin-antitoxin system VapC family toxin [Microbacterium foliorum]
MIYLDTSAAAKALIDEDGSAAMRRAFADGTAFVSSRLLAVELHAVADRRAISTDAAQELLDRVAFVSLSDDTLARAVELHSGLRTLDALHLATALEIGDAIESILTFDLEFAAAAERFGLDAGPRV